MSGTVGKKTIRVALIGNPNTGKSTLFSAMCGVRQRTGNYPGVTVEKKIGHLETVEHRLELIDLPGTYSLAPRSPDEMVTVDVLLGRRSDSPLPDVILCIVDASNLERNLYLVSQVMELGLPIVLALNMVDLAESKGLKINVAQLSEKFKLPIIPVQANRKIGIADLQSAIIKASFQKKNDPTFSPFPEIFQQEVKHLQVQVPELPRYLVERLLLDTSGYLFGSGLPGVTKKFEEQVQQSREKLKQAQCAPPGVEAVSRYKWIGTLLKDVVKRNDNRRETWSDKLDRVLTHRLWGFVFFLLLMFSLFVSVLFVAEPFKWLLDDVVFAWISNQVDLALDEGPLKSLILKGIIGGVGTVLTFLPQIFALFFFIAILEDCGYMARAAYLMDRIMSKIGLNGKSFIPLLSSYACAIPGIMGARVIENPRDRLITILVAPLMTCSARLPVYALLITTFIPSVKIAGFIPLQAIVMVSMYALGIITAVLVALLLKKTILRGKSSPFVMELPMYKMPSIRTVFFRMADQGLAFVYRAGTLILAVSVLVWAAAYYPHNSNAVPQALLQREHFLLTEMEKTQLQPESEIYVKATRELQHVRNEIEGAYLESSYLGYAGKSIEPIVKPLGWDWRIGCAAIASFPAREVIVATLGVIFNLGEDVDENSTELQNSLHNANWSGSDRKLFTIPVALSIMVFFALCAQCVSTLAVIRRETNSYYWPAFTFVYLTILAYVGAFLSYQIGTHFFS